MDREHEAPLKAILTGMAFQPTRWGVEAASSFVIMTPHPSPEFRRRVPPKLKANVEAGQADSGYDATVYDRSSREAGRKQLHGMNRECNKENPTLHETPIEDEAHVNVRRARVGLMRVEFYARWLLALSAVACPATATVK